MKLKNIFFILVLIGSLISCNQDSNKLKVLIVGFNPDLKKTTYKLNKRQLELKKTRADEFRNLLKNEFDVKIIYADQYTHQISKNYDVTIFDERPNSIGEVKRSLYGMNRKLTLKKYLPDNFNFPAIFIGYTGDMMYVSRTTKFQRKCICLAGHALNIRKEHEIFNFPKKVNLTIKKEKTPKGIFHFANGQNIGNTIDMWKVQTEDYKEGKGYFIGEVLNGDGFEDSPDCEFICGGRSDKDIDAMAIGRNGNMLHWGFAASPKFMTEEAKQVFINSIYYINKFKGKIPLVDYIAGSREELKNKIKNGFFYKETLEKFNNDKEKIKQYYIKNWNYTRAIGMTRFVVDQFCKENKIAINNPQILELSLNLLKDDTTFLKGISLLKKYTNKYYETKEEWLNWYTKNKDKLFFSQIGGYKFYEKNTMSNSIKKELNIKSSSVFNNEDKRVSIKLYCKQIKTDIIEARLKFIIQKNWHIYSYVPSSAAYQETDVQFKLSKNMKLLDSLIKPKGEPYINNPDVKIWENEVELIQKIQVIDSNKGTINCTIKYQACDMGSCDLPQEKTISLAIN